MSIEVTIPDVGESIQEMQIGKWLKQEGDSVEQDEDLVELETDKASMELPAPETGVLREILKKDGETVAIGEVIARIEETDHQSTAAEQADRDVTAKSDEAIESGKSSDRLDDPSETDEEGRGGRDSAPSDDVFHEPATKKEEVSTGKVSEQNSERSVPATPSARRALREHGLTADEVKSAGKRLRPEDVERHVMETANQDGRGSHSLAADAETQAPEGAESQLEEPVPMSLIRRRIAERLVEAQQQAALLTTFTEIDMSAVIELRQKYRERFREEYGVRLGYMPFFVKATVDALRRFPELNAEIRGHEIVYRHYYHMGIAVAGSKGLVVPVLRFVERMSFAEIEEAINDLAARANSNDLEPEELLGGTFRITNGGVYGSLLSTPIVNPPQSGVLGMHAIEDRPVARRPRCDQADDVRGIDV